MVVARRHRPQQVSVCGYLVDVYCLGVKNALGPQIINERDLPGFLRRFFTPFDKVSAPQAVPLEPARHLVWGAVDYAGQLGFEPAPISSLLPGTSGRGSRPARSRLDATASRSTSRAPSTTQPE